MMQRVTCPQCGGVSYLNPNELVRADEVLECRNPNFLAVCAANRITELERQNADLQAANNTYRERAQRAERLHGELSARVARQEAAEKPKERHWLFRLLW